MGDIAGRNVLILFHDNNSSRLFIGMITGINCFFYLCEEWVRMFARFVRVSIAFPFYGYELVTYYGYDDGGT